jgi:hypothetical protein
VPVLVLGPLGNLVPCSGLIWLGNTLLNGDRPEGRADVTDVVALSFSAANLAISWAELMSVSICLRPYFCSRSCQVSFQLAQLSGMPTLLTSPSARAASSSAFRSVCAAFADVARAIADPSSEASSSRFIRSSFRRSVGLDQFDATKLWGASDSLMSLPPPSPERATLRQECRNKPSARAKPCLKRPAQFFVRSAPRYLYGPRAVFAAALSCDSHRYALALPAINREKTAARAPLWSLV